MYNIRYHIASLVGVFLALALGLILGGLVVQRGTVDRQQGALVEGLRREFSTLRTENRELSAENAVLTDFSAEMGDEWIADRLVGRNVVVLSGAGRTDGVDAAADAVTSAGGAVIMVTLVEPDLGLRDSATRSVITSDTFSSDLVASVSASLAAEWAEPSTQHPVTEALQAAEAIVIEGFEPGMAAAGLVNVSVRDSQPNPDGLALAVAFGRQGAPVVAGESAAVPSGLAQAAWGLNVPAFNTLGTPIGRYTLVALLTGAESGLYGTVEGASASFPSTRDE